MGTISRNHLLLKFPKTLLEIMLARKLKLLHCHQDSGSANLRNFETRRPLLFISLVSQMTYADFGTVEKDDMDIQW